MGLIEFHAWPKIPRLFRDIVITEKIDGTNAAVIITEDGEVAAQSRKRLLTVDSDNFGFAGWVDRHRDLLRDLLGPGRHFGEWWGSGIQRGYGYTKGERFFSLFNVARHDDTVPWSDEAEEAGLLVVPGLYYGVFTEHAVHTTIERLRENGSFATEHKYDRPEGVVVYHKAGNQLFKVTLENDEAPKGLTEEEAA